MVPTADTKQPRTRLAVHLDGKLSRRTLLGTGVAAAGAFSLPLISFPTQALAQDEKPKQGGTMKYGLSTDPSNFEPHVSSGAAASSVKLMVYSTLLTYDSNNKIIGDLAEQFGWADKNTYQLKIRQGVTFHDGSPLTVDDVIYSLKRIQNPETTATNGPYFAKVTKIAAGDGNTVNLTFSEPFVAFPFILASTNSLIVSKKWMESGIDPKTTMMGTGPFVFKERLPGVSITVEKNPHYFLPDLPHLDGITFQPMADDTTRMTALRSGSVDFVDYVPYTQMDVIMKDKNFVLDSDSVSGFGWIAFVNNKAPVNVQGVRQAFAYGMDREKMVKTAFAGHGSPITGGLIPEGMIGYSPHLQGTYKPDFDKAKSLLKAAGHDPLSIDMLSTSTYTVISRPAEAAQAELQQADIKANLKLQEWLTFRQSVKDATFPVHAWGTAIDYGDPDFLWNYLHSTGTFAKWFHFSDPTMDKLLEDGWTEPI